MVLCTIHMDFERFLTAVSVTFLMILYLFCVLL